MQLARTKNSLFEYVIIIILGSFLSGWAAWTIIKYEDQSVFDSGWVRADNKTSNVVRISHNLGSVPKELSVWFSPTKEGNLSILVISNWSAETSGNPVSIYTDNTTIMLTIVSGYPLRGVWTLEDGWKRYNEGYFRVIAK